MIFTQEQEQIINKLNELKVDFSVVILFQKGKQDKPYLICYNSNKYRKELLEVFHVIHKQEHNGVQNSSFEAYGMDTNILNWDTCKVVGTRQVTKQIPIGFKDELVIEQVTDCDIRTGKVKEGEYTPVAEQADA